MFLFFRLMPLSPKDRIIKEGQVTEALPGASFRVALDDGSEAFGHLSGKMRINYIRLLVGDRVVIEFSPHDSTRGRIIKRL